MAGVEPRDMRIPAKEGPFRRVGEQESRGDSGARRTALGAKRTEWQAEPRISHGCFFMFSASLIFCQKMLTSGKVLKSFTVFQFVHQYISSGVLVSRAARDTALHHTGL